MAPIESRRNKQPAGTSHDNLDSSALRARVSPNMFGWYRPNQRTCTPRRGATGVRYRLAAGLVLGCQRSAGRPSVSVLASTEYGDSRVGRRPAIFLFLLPPSRSCQTNDGFEPCARNKAVTCSLQVKSLSTAAGRHWLSASYDRGRRGALERARDPVGSLVFRRRCGSPEAVTTRAASCDRFSNARCLRTDWGRTQSATK